MSVNKEAFPRVREWIMREAYEGEALQVHRCQEGWMYCGGKCAECTVNQTWTDNKSPDSTHNSFKGYKEGTNDIQ